MIIRKFQSKDVDAILQLFHDVVHTVGAKYYNPEQILAWAPENGLDKDEWCKSLSVNISYVVENEGTLIAFGDMTITGYIDRLYVHKNFQGKGAALAIFKKLEEEALKLGLKELTTEASVIAMPLAKRQGFEVISQECKVHRGVEFTTYKMRKKLS